MFFKLLCTWALLLVPVAVYGVIEIFFFSTGIRWIAVAVWAMGFMVFGLYQIWRR